MQFTLAALVALTSFVASASAAAAPRSVQALLTAVHSGSPVHQRSINANGGRFYIYKPTKVSCPKGINCSGFPNSTIIDVFLRDSEAFMAANVPGGQDIYVTKNGELSFTEPHGEGVFPKGSAHKGFGFDKTLSQLTVDLPIGGSKFFACPVDPDALKPYQVFVNTPHFVKESGCLVIGIELAKDKELGAFQYE